ncbi:hypothetical protein U9M48_036726 [Paspalum notatum var. saurae]|uniref:Uncharacterized protein n=1 Tax=Paspalum notatum var. saurae TaxID=547442 RepID=A0AAQ3UDN2_PASNO
MKRGKCLNSDLGQFKGFLGSTAVQQKQRKRVGPWRMAVLTEGRLGVRRRTRLGEEEADKRRGAASRSRSTSLRERVPPPPWHERRRCTLQLRFLSLVSSPCSSGASSSSSSFRSSSRNGLQVRASGSDSALWRRSPSLAAAASSVVLGVTSRQSASASRYRSSPPPPPRPLQRRCSSSQLRFGVGSLRRPSPFLPVPLSYGGLVWMGRKRAGPWPGGSAQGGRERG